MTKKTAPPLATTYGPTAERPRRLALAGALVAGIAACSPGPMPVSDSLRDPSNPSAREGVVPALAMAAPAGVVRRERPGHEDAGHDHGRHDPGSSEGAGAVPASEGVVYVCPMHPEVTANAPGTCPKCGMKLVPKK